MEAQWWLPPVAAFIISFFTSMVGISGAFLLLPIQISFLGLTGPAVSATNLVFNLIAIRLGLRVVGDIMKSRKKSDAPAVQGESHGLKMHLFSRFFRRWK
jgi:hypothetical protein